MFAQYGDVLDTETVRQMMGSIGICTVWKWIREGRLKHIHYLEQCYLIPKEWLIDFILSDYYQKVKHMLQAQI